MRAIPLLTLAKIATPAVLTMALFLVAGLGFLLPSVRDSIMERKRDTLKELVTVQLANLESIRRDVESGHLTLAAAQNEAIERLRNVRYGPGQQDYFWLHAKDGAVLMHPFRPDLVGKLNVPFITEDGTPLSEAIMTTARQQGAGFILYTFPSPVQPQQLSLKLSYVAAFKPWGWVLGGGMYLDDVAAQVDALVQRVARIGALIGLVVAAFLLVSVRRTVRELRARELARRELAASELRYRTVAESVSDLVWSCDLDQQVTFVSPSVVSLSGYTAEAAQVRGLPIALPEDVQGFIATWRCTPGTVTSAASFPTWTFEAPLMRADGTAIATETRLSVLVDASQRPTGLLGITRDIESRRRAERERERLEAELRHSQKLEALGTLVGGVAHDFNNILAAMLGYTELAMLDADARTSGLLRNVAEAGERARRLVRQLLTFSRRVEQARVPVHLQSVVEEALSMVRSILPATTTVQIELSDCGAVLADSNQLHQVVVNLCSNAHQAMEAKGGGILTVTLQELTPQAPARTRLPELQLGRFACLSVADTGSGIDAPTLTKIFDPFFTTKPVGKGTGLGLAVVHGIVSAHGGRIDVVSTPGLGSRFDVYLPLCEEAVQVVAPPRPATLPGGHESILVLDDERVVLEATSGILRRLGYHVTTYTEPVLALESFTKAPDAYALVITDQMMPGMTGTQWVAQALKHRAGLPVIMLTGGISEASTLQAAHRLGIAELLVKPVAARELATAVRALLDRTKPDGRSAPAGACALL